MKLLKMCLAVWLLSLSALAGKEDLESFQVVWDTINENHWDLEATGVDWQKVYTEYRPKIEAAQTRAECRTLMSQMLGELGQSHFQIMEAKTGHKAEDLRARYSGSGTPGFHVALVENRVYIVKIDPESEAFRRGLGIGTEILARDGEDLAPRVAEVVKAFEGEPNSNIYMPAVINGILAGDPGTKTTLKVVVDGETRDIDLALTIPKGEFKDLMNLSGLFFTYESKVLPGNIGYVHFNIFLPDASQQYIKDMNTLFKDTDGLIIDVRGNPGGMGILAVTLSNRLFEEKGKRLGQMMNKGGTMNFPIFPQKPLYDKPVAVLVDGASASTSEILAGGLQDLGRAKIFGTKTAGAALPSLIIDLPNGDRFQYAIADYVTYSGRHLEGVGVVPDVVTPHTPESMAKKSDAPLDAATDWIKKNPNGVNHETF